MRRRRDPGIRIGTLLLALVGGWCIPADAEFENIYTAGHADIDFVYNSQGRILELRYGFASNAVINGVVLGVAGAGTRDANTITVFIGDNGLAQAPGSLPLPFSGNPLWSIPQTSRSGRPFLGIGAGDIEPGVFVNDSLSLALSSIVQRPPGGEVIVWQTGSESTPFFNTADGLTPSDHVEVASGGHDHYNFGFSKAGTYDLKFVGSGMLLDDTSLTVEAVFRFQVSLPVSVPEPGSVLLLGIGAGLTFLGFGRSRSWGRRVKIDTPHERLRN